MQRGQLLQCNFVSGVMGFAGPLACTAPHRLMVPPLGPERGQTSSKYNGAYPAAYCNK